MDDRPAGEPMAAPALLEYEDRLSVLRVLIVRLEAALGVDENEHLLVREPRRSCDFPRDPFPELGIAEIAQRWITRESVAVPEHRVLRDLDFRGIHPYTSLPPRTARRRRKRAQGYRITPMASSGTHDSLRVAVLCLPATHKRLDR
jgi:hypothetical protein